MNHLTTTGEQPYDNLESQRLITRLLTHSDVTSWSHFFRDKESVEFLAMDALASDETKASQWINKQLKRYDEKRFGLQALIEKNSGNFIGQCGLLTQEVDGRTEIEVGYHVLREYREKGFGPEAAKLFINYAFENKITESVISIIDKRNTKSQRVAEKNSLVREKETQWSGLDVYIYRIYNSNLPR